MKEWPTSYPLERRFIPGRRRIDNMKTNAPSCCFFTGYLNIKCNRPMLGITFPCTKRGIRVCINPTEIKRDISAENSHAIERILYEATTPSIFYVGVKLNVIHSNSIPESIINNGRNIDIPGINHCKFIRNYLLLLRRGFIPFGKTEVFFAPQQNPTPPD